MAVEILTITLGDDSEKIKADDYITGDRDDTQIVTFVDGGDVGDAGTIVLEFFGKDTPTESGEGPGGNDFFFIDLAGFDDDFDIEVKSMDESDRFRFTNYDRYTVSGTVYTINYTGSDGLPHVMTIDAESQNGTGVISVVMCFVKGTGILTPDGEKPVETLCDGDSVICGDGAHRRIKWIGGREVHADELARSPDLRPVVIRAGAIDENCPTKDLGLSPQHRVLLTDWKAELLFGEDEVLVSAQSLTNDMSVVTDYACQEVTYFHILLDSHQTVFANGLECETLMPAEMSQTALTPEAREEIALLFPELVGDLSNYGQMYRQALKPHEAEALVAF